jgi:RNA polymerase sigma-70 factor (ECF subfamily)
MRVMKSSCALLEMLPQLWGFATRVSRSGREAEYLVETAYRRLFSSSIDVADMPDTPLRMQMFESVCSIWRLEFRGTEAICPSGGTLGPGASESNGSIHGYLMGAIQRLPDAQRLSMLLVAVERFSYCEAALILGVPIELLKSNVARARRTLGAMIRVESDLYQSLHQGLPSGTQGKEPDI